MPHDERDYWTSALEERHQLFRQMASGRTGEQLESLVDVITKVDGEWRPGVAIREWR